MKKLGIASSIAAVVLACVGVGSVNGAGDIRAQIVAANDVFEATFAKGDAPGVAALYTEDGQIFPPGAEAMTGQAAIAAYWSAAFASGAAGLTLDTVEVEQHGDTLIEVGSGQILDAEKNVLDSAKYIVIWKRVDGNWKLHLDIWNSNLPSN